MGTNQRRRYSPNAGFTISKWFSCEDNGERKTSQIKTHNSQAAKRDGILRSLYLVNMYKEEKAISMVTLHKILCFQCNFFSPFFNCVKVEGEKKKRKKKKNKLNYLRDMDPTKNAT